MHELDRDAAELIEQARAEARDAVRAKLRAEYEQALLERAHELLAPAPPPPGEAGEAWWVYCVVRAGRPLPDGLTGVDPDAPAPALVAAGDLAAVASRVPLAEFGEAPLRENLNDLGWLERVARAHDAVLSRLLGDGALVPLRVCTIYRDEGQVEAMLAERSAELDAALARLDGKAEWGVKAVADRQVLEEAARDQSVDARALASEIDTGPEGGAYLARKKLAALVREEANRLVADALREAHARLGEWADASVVLPAQNRELSGHRGEMVLNAAYLVDERRTDSFGAALGAIDLPGLAFELTGPWPAYNFVDAPAEALR
jgi:hypothetical protein